MTTNKNLLVELLVEELPPKSLKKLGDAFAEVLTASLKTQGVAANDAVVMAYASPRRLAVHVTNVASQSPAKETVIKLMPKKVGLNEFDERTDALKKRLEKEGYSLDDHTMRLDEIDENGVAYIALRKTELPLPLAEALQQALGIALKKLPIAKVMTYPDPSGDGWITAAFVRPAHRLVALHGAEVVRLSGSQLGLTVGRETQGHRFEAASATLEIRDADSYEAQMENEGAVTPSFEKRRAEIARQLAEAAAKIGGEVRPIADDALLDEVTALVERPNVLVGKFDAAFLEVPQECLILTMKAHQKYFPLLDANGKLTNRFLIVSNIHPADASLVISGNERVLRARLADARFFFDQDRKRPLDSRVLGLTKVVYHNKLGSQSDRVERVQAIARAIGQQLGGDALALQADQAALLAKADLLTDMVGEFPELQGIMGRYYAQHDGVNDNIAYAIEDHYKPRFAGDELPRNMVGICVALADKLETLVGMFGIGQILTGDKDPFALRRHALGVIRMLVEKNLSVSLTRLLAAAARPFMEQYLRATLVPLKLAPDEAAANYMAALNSHFGVTGTTGEELTLFIYDRLSGSLREQGYSAQEIDAVISLEPELLADVPKRLAAVRAFAALPEAASLAAANKRVSNILKKVEGDFVLRQARGERFGIDVALLQEPAEQALHQILNQIAPKAEAAFATGDYTASLQILAALKEPVDTFFDKVMVNTEDAALRANRLALLLQLQHAMNRVADISKLAT